MLPRRGMRFGVAAIITAASAVAYGQNPPNRAVAAQLDALIAKLPKNAQVGLVVLDVKTGSPWYARNADLPLKPASLQKLLITAAVVERFGLGFHYRTEFYVHAGELWVRGAGDPGLGDPRLADRDGRPRDELFDCLAAALKARGVTRLTRIVLDDTIFDRQGRHEDWPVDQQDRWYQAPIGGLNYNDNCLDVTLAVRDSRVEAKLTPPLPAELFNNTLVRGKRHQPVLHRSPNEDVFELRGTATRGGELASIAVNDATTFFGHALFTGLERRGVAVAGPAIRRALAATELADETPLLARETPLADVLWRCNTFSQNMFAEALMKSLSAYGPDGKRTGTPGGWDASRPILLTTLTTLRLDVADATIRDGCGLSHNNRVTALHLAQLLYAMAHRPAAAAFKATLAAPGEPGSVQNRYDDPALRGRLRAKTGTISGVRGLAGYLERPDGTTLAFALLINGHDDAEVPLQMCKALLAEDGER